MAGIFYTYLLSTFLMFHPFFVSVTELKHNVKDKTIEISCKLFIDDFEKALTAAYKAPVDLNNPKNKEQTDMWITGYFKQHFQLKVNGQVLPVAYVGYEKEGEAAWCYLVVNNAPATVKLLEVTNNLLYELFESQIHIMHATVNGARKSTKVANPESKVVFDF